MIKESKGKQLQIIIVLLYFLLMLYLQVIPSAVDLVKTSQCGCAVSDILRMEMIILSKLQWSVKTVTQIDFLHIVSSLNMSCTNY